MNVEDATVAEEETEMEVSSEGEEETEDEIHKAKQAITCRSVTLSTLIDDGVIQPGQSVLTIDYLGQRFEADLLPSGKIKWHGSEEVFGTPSAWALHCKRLVNPIKRSGCGWASVKYIGKKLDIWKSIWARKHRVNNPHKSTSGSSGGSSPIKKPHTSTSLSPVRRMSPVRRLHSMTTLPTSTDTNKALGANITSEMTPTTSSTTPASITHCITTTSSAPSRTLSVMTDSSTVTQGDVERSPQKHGASPTVKRREVTQQQFRSEEMPTAFHKEKCRDAGKEKRVEVTSPLNLSRGLPALTGSEIIPPPSMLRVKATETSQGTPLRKTVSYKTLGVRGQDVSPLTLVRCEEFDQHSKLQPFTVSVTTNALLLMDFHCHLTQSEVIGYLGGRWDPNKQHVNVDQVYPACCRLEDKDRAALVEEEIRHSMRQRHHMVVGWYHSHPRCGAYPSVRDVDTQMAHQLSMRTAGSMYLPCIGFIVSPFEIEDGEMDSWIQAFWVMPNLEQPSSFNIPMSVNYSMVRDPSLTEDVLADMKRLTEHYSSATDKVRLRERWRETITYVEKVRGSLTSKLPEDQLDSGTFLDYVQQLLTEMK